MQSSISLHLINPDNNADPSWISVFYSEEENISQTCIVARRWSENFRSFLDSLVVFVHHFFLSIGLWVQYPYSELHFLVYVYLSVGHTTMVLIHFFFALTYSLIYTCRESFLPTEKVDIRWPSKSKQTSTITILFLFDNLFVSLLRFCMFVILTS